MRETSKLSHAIRLALFAGALTAPAYTLAADANEVEVKKETTVQPIKAAETDGLEEELEEGEVEKITVTGSRIRRAEFSNASPVQIITGDVSRELGLFDASGMLQSTNQAAGSQIDNTFGGYVLDNGPGSATIGFRGLGADRTLVLINGRRMAPAGVGGAPTSPDLNLIPGVMIERIENLYDGASAVYGSDAVAGVANVILRQDVEGFELQGSINKPKGGGGQESVLSAMYGKTFDNGFITVGAEYTNREAQSKGQNEFTSGCEVVMSEDKAGNKYSRYGDIGPVKGGESNCDIFPLTNRMFIYNGFWGSVYNTPGFTNTGIPGWSESSVPTQYIGLLPNWVGGDSNGDGIDDTAFPDGPPDGSDMDGYKDFDFQDPLYAFQQSDYYKSGDYLSKNERISVVANGEYNFQDDNDTKVYFDALYASRNSDTFSPGAQMFQTVGADNPYNPCNTRGTNGIDCFGVLGFGPGGDLDVQPILNIRGDRDTHEVDVSQYRLVTGITGDLTALEGIGLNNWYYDAYVSYSASSGKYVTSGISEANLVHSLDTSVLNADGSVTCGDGTDGCVPVNLFSDNIYQVGGGTLTSAEQNYLMVDRIADTKVNQFVANGFAGGDIFTLPWNNEVVSGIIGLEYRRDEIISDNNDVAREGYLWGWFSDKGANGSRNLKEVFTEIDLPLVKGQPGIEELSVTVGGRITKESFYDAASTYSLKAVYRPVDWFTIRGTQGTSYRAPNLRERFLEGTSGFNSVSDPCVVSGDARVSDPLNPTAPDSYDPTKETRTQGTMDACAADGVDPTSLGLGQNGTDKFTATSSAEVTTGGSTTLSEETSVAKTYGVIFEQPFTDAFDLTMSVTRFDIEITNSISEPSSAYSIDQCYSAAGNDAFCSRIGRDSNGQISNMDGSFINAGLETSKGYDYNIYFHQELLLGDRNIDLVVDLQATQMTEALYDVLGSVDDNLGEPTIPEWRASARLSLSYDDYSFNWMTRFIGAGEPDWVNDNENGYDYGFSANEPSCAGLYSDDAKTEPLLCRPVAQTTDYFVHDMSISWTTDDFGINVGIRNVFNEAPPLVDGSGLASNTNVPLGVGYDTLGRTPFINFKANF